MADTINTSSFSSVVGSLGTIGNIVLTAYGLFAQDDANQEARNDARIYNERVLGIQEKTLAEKIAGRKGTLAFNKAESRKNWKWMEEERGYGRAQEFAKNFNSVLEKEPMFKNNLAQIWGGQK